MPIATRIWFEGFILYVRTHTHDLNLPYKLSKPRNPPAFCVMMDLDPSIYAPRVTSIFGWRKVWVTKLLLYTVQTRYIYIQWSLGAAHPTLDHARHEPIYQLRALHSHATDSELLI